MAAGISSFASRGASGFQRVLDSFLSCDGLAFAKVLSAERINAIFAKHNGLFGGSRVYSTAVVLWSFLGQVLRDRKEGACQAAVARVVTYCLQFGIVPPTSDTGDYCRARSKLRVAALRELSFDIANEAESLAPDAWLWQGLHAKLVDGTTFTMPDTPENQQAFPHPKSQKPGVGLPIARAVVILSLATACALDAEIGPYSGKQTGETALLRSLFSAFHAGDVAVLDRYYCSFMMIALLHSQGVHICTRLHQKRPIDFRRGKRLGHDDHLVVWIRPKRPEWMDEESYASIPAQLTLREIRYQVVEPGRRTQSIVIVTTLTDADQYSCESLAQLYGFRWNAELDIRSIKSSLNMGHLKCKTPEMVRCELWTTLLAYNLIRLTAAGAALLHDKKPRHISFTSTCQYVLSAWCHLSSNSPTGEAREDFCKSMLAQIAACKVADRPGRLEPRVIKRRLHHYPLMQEPRSVLKDKLKNVCT